MNDKEQWIKDYREKNSWRHEIAYVCDVCKKVVTVAQWEEHKKEHQT